MAIQEPGHPRNATGGIVGYADLALGDRVEPVLEGIAALRTSARVAAATAGDADVAPRSDAERRQLTVMFCDLVGSTPLSSQLDPEDLREVIAAYQRAVAEVVSRRLRLQVHGRRVLVYFGCPQAHEDDAARAVWAGLGAIDAVRRLDVKSGEWPFRLGTASGKYSRL